MINLNYKLLFILSLFFYTSATSQNPAKFGFELIEYLKTANLEEQVPLLVEGNPEEIKRVTEQLGGNVRLEFQRLFSLEIPAKNIPLFSESSAVDLIEFSITPGRSLSDTMLVHTNVDSIIQMAAPLKQAYSGKGVILGVIDSGIELAHPDFQDSTGKTRVLYVWDQRQAFNPSQQALNYNYGVEWDSAAINSGLSTHDDGANEFGHGSNVTGVAASNGLASGQYRGVAPEVNIITVATDFNKINWLQTVTESVDYIFKKADALGMPCIINASVGTYVGSHDGLDIGARIIAGLINQKSGRSFVCANGNAGNRKFHVQQEITNDTAFTWFENNVAQWAGLGGFYFEVWADTANTTNLDFAIGADSELNGNFSFQGRTAFSKIRNRLNAIYYDTLRNAQGIELATIETYAEQSQGRYKLEVAIVRPDSVDFLYRFETKGTGKIDIYSSYSLFRHNNMRSNNLPTISQYSAMSNYAKPDSMQTMVSSFTCSPSVISVGNHYNRSTYIDVRGTLRNMNVTPGFISVNSSLGPNRLNNIKPDVSSAGDFMFGSGRLATIRGSLNSNPGKISQDTMHWRNGGTSMASPTVAGMIALYFQMCPKATQTQILSDLHNSAKKDQFTSAQDNFTYGHGKADGFNLLKRRVFAPSLAVPLPILCIGDSLPLDLSTTYQRYSWNTGDSTNQIIAAQSDRYFATVQNQFGCEATTDTLNLIFNPIPPKPAINRAGDFLGISANGFYQWYFNGSRIMGGINATHQAQMNGNYFCEFTDSNSCSINSDTANVIITSIEEWGNSSTTIFPNPSNGKIKLKTLNLITIKSVELFDLTGKLIWSKEINETGQHFNLNLSLIQEGIYFFQATSLKGVIQKKILIK